MTREEECLKKVECIGEHMLFWQVCQRLISERCSSIKTLVVGSGFYSPAVSAPVAQISFLIPSKVLKSCYDVTSILCIGSEESSVPHQVPGTICIQKYFNNTAYLKKVS